MQDLLDPAAAWTAAIDCIRMMASWALETADSIPVPVLIASFIACLIILRWPTTTPGSPLPTHSAFPYGIACSGEKRPLSPLCSYVAANHPATPFVSSYTSSPSPIPSSPYSAKLVETPGGFTWVPIRRSPRSSPPAFPSGQLSALGGVGPRGLGILNEADEEIGLCSSA